MKKFLSLFLILILLAIGVYFLKPSFLSTPKSCPTKVPDTIPAVPGRSPCGEDGCPPYEPPTLQRHSPPAPVLTSPEDPDECPYMIIEPDQTPADEEETSTYESNDMQSSNEEVPSIIEPESSAADPEALAVEENNMIEPTLVPESEPVIAVEVTPQEEPVIATEEPAAVEPIDAPAIASKVLPEDEPDYGSQEKEQKQKEDPATFAASPPPEQDTSKKPRLRRLGYPPSE